MKTRKPENLFKFAEFTHKIGSGKWAGIFRNKNVFTFKGTQSTTDLFNMIKKIWHKGIVQLLL